MQVIILGHNDSTNWALSQQYNLPYDENNEWTYAKKHQFLYHFCKLFKKENLTMKWYGACPYCHKPVPPMVLLEMKIL